MGRAGVCLFADQAAMGHLRRDAKDAQTLAVGGEARLADVPTHASPQGRGREREKGGSR